MGYTFVSSQGRYPVKLFLISHLTQHYSWKLPKDFEINKKSTFLVFNVGINNLLNNKDIVTGGFEQLRYDAQLSSTDPVQAGKFPPKLFYAYGLNFFASMTLRF